MPNDRRLKSSQRDRSGAELVATNRAEVEQLRDEVRILRGAAPSANNEGDRPEQEETKRSESKVDDWDLDTRFVGSP